MSPIIRFLLASSLLLLSVVTVYAQSQQPGQQDVPNKIQSPQKQEKVRRDQNKNSPVPTSLIPHVPSNNLKHEASDKAEYKQESPYKNWWDIPQNPVEVFTLALAIFTFALVIAGFYQVAIARKASRKQLRAYVFVDSSHVVNVIPPPVGATLPQNAQFFDQKSGPIGCVTIKNFGQTPAYNLRHCMSICLREFPLLSALPDLDRSDMASMTETVVPPGGRFFYQARIFEALSGDRIEELRKGASAIYVYGDIVYTDIFGNRQFTKFTRFANRFTGLSYINDTMTGYVHGNEAS